MNILLAFDKFKGSLSADAVAQAVLAGLLDNDADLHYTIQSVADGGGGTLKLLSAQWHNAQFISVEEVHDPIGRLRNAQYLRLNNTAYIEMAEASGIELILDRPLNALQAQSYGTGQLMTHAIDQGCSEIYLMLGGSASTDLGTGALSALGVQFYDHNQQEIKTLNGHSLGSIHSINANQTRKRLARVSIKILCDVDNSLLGVDGSAQTYGPQKGATPKEVVLLESSLARVADIIESNFEVDIRNHPGAGAAGGLAAGLMGVLGAKMISGSEAIANWLNLDDLIKYSDMVLTGEGSFDEQSLQGKIVGKIISLAKKYHKPLNIICGTHNFAESPSPISSIYSVLDESANMEDSISNPRPKLKLIGEKISASLKK